MRIILFLASILFVTCTLYAEEKNSESAIVPMMVLDESADDWVVDRFAGNSTAGPKFIQGPAREVGGLGRPGSVACAPDGTVYFSFGEEMIAEVSPDGILRLAIGGGGNEYEGHPGTVIGGSVAWNPKESMLYIAGANCIRRLTVKPDKSRYVEVVAGTPGKPGLDDGPAKTATFTTIGSMCINSRGAIYFLDGKNYGECLRKFEDGQVVTISRKLRSGKLADGPLDQACFNLIGLGGNISLGEDDDILYLADHWNFVARRIDVKNGQVTTIAGMQKPKEWQKEKQTEIEKRYNQNADGPALTYASFNSGCGYCCYDRVHKALWVGGPDESRFRWVKDGWVRTVIGRKISGSAGSERTPADALGVPSAQVHFTWNSVNAVDNYGRAYLAASSHPTGLWRAYNRKAVKP